MTYQYGYLLPPDGYLEIEKFLLDVTKYEHEDY